MESRGASLALVRHPAGVVVVTVFVDLHVQQAEAFERHVRLIGVASKCLVGQDEISKRRISEVLSRETWARIRHNQPPGAGESRTPPDTDA